MKNKKITFLISLSGMLLVSPALAAMEYPVIAGITISGTTTAAEYIIYFFNLSVAVGAFIAAVVLAMAGVDYVSSQGEPAKIESAKSKIKNAFLGLTILLGAFIILNIINPQLTNIKIDQLENNFNQTVVVPEGKGVYLYDATNFTSSIDPLIVTGTKASFLNDNFTNKAQSIKFVNPDSGFKFGAVLFADYQENSQLVSGSNLRGNCSYLLSDLSDLNNSLGKENNPPVGKNNLSSIIVFKTNSSSATVKLYNNINCEKRNEDYGKHEDKEDICTISSGTGFANIKEACPDFKGDVLSIETSSDVGVLLKAADKDAAGRCQFFESGNTSCINTIKYSFVYKLDQNSATPTIVPQSFIVFPLVK